MSAKLASTIKTTALAATLGLAAFFGGVDLALAQGAGATGSDCPDWLSQQGGCDKSLRQMVLTILNWFLLFLGLIAIGFTIYGGFTYVTSAGNEEKVGEAKKIITYALVGIVVVLISWAAVNAILGIAQSGGASAQ